MSTRKPNSAKMNRGIARGSQKRHPPEGELLQSAAQLEISMSNPRMKMGGPNVVKRAKVPKLFSESLAPPVLLLCPAKTVPAVVRTQVIAAVHFTCFTRLDASPEKRYGPIKAMPK